MSDQELKAAVALRKDNGEVTLKHYTLDQLLRRSDSLRAAIRYAKTTVNQLQRELNSLLDSDTVGSEVYGMAKAVNAAIETRDYLQGVLKRHSRVTRKLINKKEAARERAEK